MSRRRHRSARRREPKPVGELVGAVLDDLGIRRDPTLHAILERWELLVGAEASAHCRPDALHAGILEVATDSSVWCQQMALQRESLLAALAAELGDAAPRELWFHLDPTDES